MVECHEQSHRDRNELVGLEEAGLTRSEKKQTAMMFPQVGF